MVPSGRGCNPTLPASGAETAGRLLPTGGLGVLIWLGRYNTVDRPRFAIRQPSGPLGLYVVDGVPEPRHPTLAGAASTGPPVPTGAATAVVAVHDLGGLVRIFAAATLALQDISIVLQSYQF